jgi:hypothetical protein
MNKQTLTAAQQTPGSARVSRAGFGVSPKQSSEVRECEMRALPGENVNRDCLGRK